MKAPAIDMEAHSQEAAARKAPSAASLRSLSNFLDKQRALEDEVAGYVEKMAAAQEKLTKLIEKDIPGLFDQLGLKEIKLADGRVVTVDAKVYASITEDNKPAAFQWMRDNNLDGIIKTAVNVEFGKDSDALALKVFTAVQKLVKDKGKLTSRQSVHPSTLNATIRELLRAGGVAIPDCITTAEVKKSVIKVPKK